MSSRHSRGGKASKRDTVADAEAAPAAAAVLGLPGNWCDDVGGSTHHTYTSHRHSRALHYTHKLYKSRALEVAQVKAQVSHGFRTVNL